MYSALPTYDWSLSVPISWDDNLSQQWSAVVNYDPTGDPSNDNAVGLVIYNEDDTVSNFYTVSVYDTNGNLVGQPQNTPTVAHRHTTSTGQQGGTYAFLLGDLFPGLSTGLYKILIDGGSYLSGVEVLQTNGPSATTLQVAFDTAPSSAAAVKHARSTKRVAKTVHVMSETRRVGRPAKK